MKKGDERPAAAAKRAEVAMWKHRWDAYLEAQSRIRKLIMNDDRLRAKLQKVDSAIPYRDLDCYGAVMDNLLHVVGPFKSWQRCTTSSENFPYADSLMQYAFMRAKGLQINDHEECDEDPDD
jgi:hypothetical protein